MEFQVDRLLEANKQKPSRSYGRREEIPSELSEYRWTPDFCTAVSLAGWERMEKA